ncbi:hypothetical protein A0257_20570 [Hymenobacter psoromatis]|nr:hypothetical protein A0257_20570 [Hymenobacter psoromatis]
MAFFSSRRLGAMRLVVSIFLGLLPGLIFSALAKSSPALRSVNSPRQANPADTVRTGGLTGRLQSLDGKPLEYANVLLLRAADSVLVKATLSDAEGQFTLANVLPGRYRVRAQQLGYRDGRSAVVRVAGGPALALPALVLAPAAQALGEVQVTGRKPVIERQIDRLVVNVDQLPAAAGGSAYDVIKSTPGVTISATDAIGMQGKSGVLVLIDDRPVRLSPDALANMLRNMPAESIQTLEVITTPPAKYDAEGNAGILNIRTRQRQQPGWNTDLTLRGAQGHYSRYSGGAVVGIKRKAIDLNGSYFLGRTRSFEDITQYATQRAPGQALPSELRATSHQLRTARYHDAKAQLDVKTGPKSSAGLVANLYILNNPAEGTGTARTFSGAQPTDTTVQTQSHLGNASYNYSVDGYYTVRLDSVGKTVSVDANYARFGTDQQQDFANQTVDEARAQPVGGPQQLRSQLAGGTVIHSLKADVTLPYPHFKLETGAKYSRVDARNDFRFQRQQGSDWVTDAQRTNQFEYQENTPLPTPRPAATGRNSRPRWGCGPSTRTRWAPRAPPRPATATTTSSYSRRSMRSTSSRRPTSSTSATRAASSGPLTVRLTRF